jgi:DNA-binding MarR family transcriptional regulator
MRAQLSQREQVIRSLLDSLDPFLELRHTMPARTIQAFLLVAQTPGLSVLEYARLARVSATTMSRNLLDLGDRNRYFQDGHGLVLGGDNENNRRERVYHLTEKGETLMLRLINRVRP